MTHAIDNRSYWNATAPAVRFPALSGELSVDVAIVGGGIVGVTTARLLKDRGLTVALVEARRIGEEVTGKSTAKITSQHNVTYTTIRRKFGEEGARLYAEANEAGLAAIRNLAAGHRIDCDLESADAIAFTQDEQQVSAIEDEAKLAAELGLPATLTRETGLPFDVLAAMRWTDQARFHPVKYLKALAATLPGGGCHVFEDSRVIDWDPDRIATSGGTVRARHVVMATHLPLGQIGLFYTEAHPHMDPVLMGRVDPARAPQGMYINVEQPRRSFRLHRDAEGQSWMIFAGTAHKPGETETQREKQAEIERFAAETFGVRPEYRWTNEDYGPIDQAPFVGWSSSLRPGYLVATGFNAWGITNGTAAAMLIADLATGRDNPWLKLFDATRIKPIAGAAEFVKGNAEVAGHLIGGYLKRKPHEFETLEAGEGRVLKIDGHNVAAYRDDQGEVHAVSAVCTHMGCLVGWNGTDRTWDCPCHGSRFEPDGTVLHGPAVTPLARADGEEGSGAARGVEEVAGA
jgi:glycine/D-amino acid oxidase-like deaminating enzyme/nitrite reductase/ring-hydroxylating ferredoxin subunit